MSLWKIKQIKSQRKFWEEEEEEEEEIFNLMSGGETEGKKKRGESEREPFDFFESTEIRRDMPPIYHNVAVAGI